MTDPYETFGLSTGADEATIRRRYLELVRQHPPDQSPARFAEIHAAYDELRDPVRRLEQRLFEGSNNDSLEDIIVAVRTKLRGERIPVDTLLSLAETH